MYQAVADRCHLIDPVPSPKILPYETETAKGIIKRVFSPFFSFLPI
jgi:hypothetical protein